MTANPYQTSSTLHSMLCIDLDDWCRPPFGFKALPSLYQLKFKIRKRISLFPKEYLRQYELIPKTWHGKQNSRVYPSWVWTQVSTMLSPHNVGKPNTRTHGLRRRGLSSCQPGNANMLWDTAAHISSISDALANQEFEDRIFDENYLSLKRARFSHVYGGRQFGLLEVYVLHLTVLLFARTLSCQITIADCPTVCLKPIVGW